MQGLIRRSFVLLGLMVLDYLVEADTFENKTEWTRTENTEISPANATVYNDVVFVEETKTDPGEYPVTSSGQEKLLEANWTSKDNSDTSVKFQRQEYPVDKMYVTNIPEESEDIKAEESSVLITDKWLEPAINWTANKNHRNTKKSTAVRFPVDKVLVTNYSEGSEVDDEELSSESAGISESSSAPSETLKDNKKSTSKLSSEFKPSVHLGEILQEPTGNPFNQLRHLEFQGTIQSLHPPENGAKIQFQDDLTNSYSVPENAHFSTAEQNYPKISPTTFEKPVHTDFQNTGNFPGSDANSFGFLQHRPQYGQIPLQGNVFENIEKPPAPLIYLSEQESTFTRTRKFPYQFYQPYVGYGDVEYLEEPHPVVHYSRPRSISPWKKIIHLIGAFLPLGLLIAALTPNVVKVDNATQPNIVLSKLRVVDLPAEHKHAQQDDRPASHSCEDRSICEIILASEESSTNLLQSILWNLAVRTPEETAKKNGLREIFQAVKKKDCTLIECMN